MKRILILVLAGLAGIAGAAVFHVDEDLRWCGSSTPSTNDYWIVVDSSDTLEDVTVYSDTFVIDSLAKWIVGEYALNGFTPCDSCNDSVLVIITGHTAYNGSFGRTVLTDTLATTLDSTAAKSLFWLSLDSTIANQFWMATQIKDSVITTVSDSFRTELQYKVGDKAVEALYQ